MSRRSRVKPVANLRSSVRKRPNFESNLTEDKEDVEEDKAESLDQSSESKIVEEEQIKSENNSKENSSQAEEYDNNNTFKIPQTRTEDSENNEANTSQNAIQNKSRLRLKKIQPRLGITRNSSSAFSQKPAPVETITEKNAKISSQFEKSSRDERDSENNNAAQLEDVQNADRTITRNLFDTQNNEKEASSSSATPNSSTLGSQFNFPHPPHSRIRTESLCSIKSNFSGIGGVVRKNFRSEENQRIIDTKRESKVRLSNKNLDKTQLLMFDMIYYNPTSNPMKISDKSAPKRDRSRSATPVVELPEKPKEPEVAESSNCLVPQVKLGPNGEMILDEKSLVVENEQQKKSRILLANANVVYDDELSGAYGYYKRQKRTREWLPEETVKFYRCLHTIGTDFSLMLQLFPDRSRRDLKLKFKKEEKNNLALINKALMHPNKFDIDELKRNLEHDDLMRKKDSENKMKSEVNAKLKKEILKKQASAAKTRKKSKVDRMLTEAETANQMVDGTFPTNDANETKTRREMSEVTNLTNEPPAKRPKRHSKKMNVVDHVQTPEITTSTNDKLTKNSSNVNVQSSEAYMIELATETPPILIDFPQENALTSSQIVQKEIDLSQSKTLLDESLSANNNNALENENSLEVTRVDEDMDVDYSCNSSGYYPDEDNCEKNFMLLKQDSSITKPPVIVSTISAIETVSALPQSTNKTIEECPVLPEAQKTVPVVSSSRKGSKKVAPKLQQRKTTTQNESKPSNLPSEIYPSRIENELNQFSGSNQATYILEQQFDQYPPTNLDEKPSKYSEIGETKTKNPVIISNELVDFPISIKQIDSTVILLQNEIVAENILNLNPIIQSNLSEEHHVQKPDLEASFNNACDSVQSSFLKIEDNNEKVSIVEVTENKKQQEIFDCDLTSIKTSNLFNFDSQQISGDRIEANLEDQINVNDLLPTFSNAVKFQEVDQNDKIILEAPLIILGKESNLLKTPDQATTSFETIIQNTEISNHMENLQTNTEQTMEVEKINEVPSVSGFNKNESSESTKDTEEKSQKSSAGSENQEESDDDDDDYYDNLLNDIDLNSLVMVESQVDNEIIHEIYIMDPVTEQLSEKPLDLPADIIENIRRVLNSEENNE